MSDSEVNFLSLVDAIIDDRKVKPMPRPEYDESEEEEAGVI